jgi:hypothetical protein
MSSHIPESDWRHFKEVRQKLLDRHCTRTLKQVAAVSQSTQGTAYERYIKVYKLMEERDRQIAHAFNDFRRSTAIRQLSVMRRMKLLTDEDFSVFSEQTRTFVDEIASL